MPARNTGSSRAWSLRREWSRAFTVMLVLLLMVSAVTYVGVRQLVGQYRGAAQQLAKGSVVVNSLRARVNLHEGVAHILLGGGKIDQAAFLREQAAIGRAYDAAAHAFPGNPGASAMVNEAHRRWQAALTSAGLWEGQPLVVDNKERQARLADDSDAAQALLDDVQKPSLDAMHSAVASAATLERILTSALVALFGAALGMTVYFRRRMARDLIRPVADMHEGVMKLQAGDYGNRIEVVRRDELGELAEAFNLMSAALHDSHQALTLRATHDSLTGLPNRASLTDRLSVAFGPSRERRAMTESVLFIDIDDFKDVNDSLGHEGGDTLLVELAARLNRCVRPQDLVARLGGDEFAIVVVEEAGSASASEVAQRVLDAMQAPFAVGDTSLVVSVSIGLAKRRPDTADVGDLLRRADFAMYMAKGAGKGRCTVFDAQVHSDMVSRAALKTDLRRAVSAGQLRIEYQAVADLRTGEVVGVEALARWQHPTLGLLPPADFIELAEETEQIGEIGRWMLDTAARQVAGWRHTMDHCADLWLSVNISARQLTDPGSLRALHDILADPAVQAGQIVLEVTESALVADVDAASASLSSLKALGVRIAIDDFGTGFSSLSTLASLPVDILKIDRSFVSGQASAAPSVPMLEGILGLAAKLSLDVIAEGIEDTDQLELLRTLGCRVGQGYLLARPAAPDAVVAVLGAGGLLRVPVPT